MIHRYLWKVSTWQQAGIIVALVSSLMMKMRRSIKWLRVKIYNVLASAVYQNDRSGDNFASDSKEGLYSFADDAIYSKCDLPSSSYVNYHDLGIVHTDTLHAEQVYMNNHTHQITTVCLSNISEVPEETRKTENPVNDDQYILLTTPLPYGNLPKEGIVESDYDSLSRPEIEKHLI